MIDVDALAAALMEQAEDELRGTGRDLRDEVAGELRDAAQDLASLVARRAQGEDVSSELPHVRARTANWTWIGASRVRRRWADWLAGTAHVLREVAAAAVDVAL